MSTAIPTVPTTEINLSNDGLKNLAGWLARYVKLENNSIIRLFGNGYISEGFKIDELLHNGDLIKYEPSLAKYKGEGKYEPDLDQYKLEPYEFELSHESESFFIEPNNNEVFIRVYFTFVANNKVSVYANIECCSENDDTYKHIRTTFLEKYLKSFGFSDFEIDNEHESMHKEMSWLTADGIIKTISSQPKIPGVPA